MKSPRQVTRGTASPQTHGYTGAYTCPRCKVRGLSSGQPTAGCTAALPAASAPRRVSSNSNAKRRWHHNAQRSAARPSGRLRRISFTYVPLVQPVRRSQAACGRGDKRHEGRDTHTGGHRRDVKPGDRAWASLRLAAQRRCLVRALRGAESIRVQTSSAAGARAPSAPQSGHEGAFSAFSLRTYRSYNL